MDNDEQEPQSNDKPERRVPVYSRAGQHPDRDPDRHTHIPSDGYVDLDSYQNELEMFGDWHDART